MIEEAYILKLIQDVQGSRKYRDLDLPDAFLRDLIEYECQFSKNKKFIKENFRKKSSMKSLRLIWKTLTTSRKQSPY